MIIKTVKQKNFRYTDVQTNTVLFTPCDGLQMILSGCYLKVTGTQDTRITIFFDSNSQDNWIFDADLPLSKVPFISINEQYLKGIYCGINKEIKITTSAACTISGKLIGYEDGD